MPSEQVVRGSFGNARAVRKPFEQSGKEVMAREDNDNDLEFYQTVDLGGDRPSSVNPKFQAVLDEVEKETGWTRQDKGRNGEAGTYSDENNKRERKGHETVLVCGVARSRIS